MKTARISIAILTMAIWSTGKAYSQQADSIKSNRITYIRNLLKIDTTIAHRVSDIQDNYKQAIKQMLGNGALSDQQKRAAIDSLINEKNKQLEDLLPEAQRNLLIPTTERKRTWKRDTTAKN